MEKVDLGYFIGTEQYYFDPMVKDITYTEGVSFLRENEHNFLISDILVVLKHLKNKGEIKEEDFIIISFKKNEDGKRYFKIFLEDSNNNKYDLYKQTYDICFSQNEITFYFSDNILLLSSEY